MMVKLGMISGPFQAILFTVITWNPESNCTWPREESFPVPLKYIDVARTTHTHKDVMQESRIDDYLEYRPELWIKMGRNAKLKERQKWSHEKTQLDNARKLRGIYFIDPKDTEFKETIKNARKKLETPVAPAMPCKISKINQNWATGGKSNKTKSKLACIL